MRAFLEVHRPQGVRVVPLEGGQITIGRALSNTVDLGDDDVVSRLHALLEELPGGWCLRDLSSRNGTFVNGERIDRDRVLHAGDEVRVGDTRLVYRADKGSAGITEVP